MNIILFCVFGVNPFSAGNMQTAPVSVSRAYYEIIKYEEGQDEVLRLCRRTFHRLADLAWFHDV